MMFGGGHKRQREAQGYAHGNSILDSTIASTVASGLDPPSPLDWPAHITQDFKATYPTGATTAHKLAGPCVHPAAAAPAAMSQSYIPSGYQQPSSAADVSTGTTMLYGRYRHDQASSADSQHGHSSHAAAVDPQMQSRLAADQALKAYHQQQHLLHVQRQQQEAAAKAQQQQQMLLAQAQQQQHQAALARSAAAAAAVSAGGLPTQSLYGNYRMNAGWDSSVGTYNHQRQQLFGLHAQHNMSAPPGAGLPPRPVTHPQCSSTWSDPSEAAAVATADAAQSARVVLQQLQDQSSNISSSSRLASAYGQQAAAAAGTNPAAAGARNVGRWAGQLGIIDSPAGNAPGSAESGANNGGFGLECDEDLLSLETGDAYQLQQQLHRQQHIVHHTSNSHGMFSPDCVQGFAEDTGSTNNSASGNIVNDDVMEDPAALDSSALVAAQAAAVAAHEAATAKHAVVLQVIGTTAQLRKGGLVLTSAPAYAAAAGAESVRSRLLITEVSVYTEKGACSQLALDQANKLLNKMALPDDIAYMPVSSESFLFRAGAAWQFPAFVICLGSSYLQRMFARLPQLAEAALACPGFEDYCQYLPDQYQGGVRRRLSGPEATATLATLRSVQFTCLFIATKVADQIHALGLLRFMLTNLSHNGAVVSLQQAADVEARCLDALGWRLGPFFCEDELSGDDEDLWAESMGHWNYGSDRDKYPEPFC